MRRPKSYYSPELKVRVVLELLQGRKSAAQVCREYKIAPPRLSEWQQEFLQKAPSVFATDESVSDAERRIAELERLVGRLTVQLDASKKVSSLLNSR